MDSGEHKKQIDRARWPFFLWGLLTGLLLAVLSAGVILGVVLMKNREQLLGDLMDTPDVYVDLSVAADGCGVTRSERSGSTPVDRIIWVIEDAEGFSVLERVADDEYQYRYFAAGHYTVHVKALYDSRYFKISNEVEIDC